MIRHLLEVDAATHRFYAAEYLLPGRARWRDASPDRDALAPYRSSAGRALDLGCGFGRNALWLAEAGWDVLGVDLYPWPVRVARRRARARGLEGRARFGVASALRLAGPGRFDLAVDVLGPASDLPARRLPEYARRLRALLAPSGRALVYSFLTRGELSALEVTLTVARVEEDGIGRWLELSPQDG